SGLTLDAIRERLAGYAWFAYTTFAHRTAAPRWRIIVPTDGPLDAASHRATWTILNQMVGGAAAVAAKDISRLNYLPGACIAPDEARYAQSDGRLFPVVPAPPEAAPAAFSGGPSDGPVEGWCGPSDDTELLERAFRIRIRPEERFGPMTLLQALWFADEA